MSRHSVEPTAAAFASSCRAEFAAEIVKHLRQLRVLRRQCAIPYSRRVRFHYADDTIHPMRWHASAGARAARCRV